MRNLKLAFALVTVATITPNAQASEKKEPEPMSWPDAIAESTRSWRQSLANQIDKGILETKDPKVQADILYRGSTDLAEKMKTERDRMPELKKIAQYLHDHRSTVNVSQVTTNELLEIAIKRGQSAGEVIRLLSPKIALPPEANRVHNMTQLLTPFLEKEDLPELFSNLMTEEQAQAFSEQCLQKLAESGELPALLATLLTVEQTAGVAHALANQLPKEEMTSLALTLSNKIRTKASTANTATMRTAHYQNEAEEGEEDNDQETQEESKEEPVNQPYRPVAQNNVQRIGGFLGRTLSRSMGSKH